MGKKHNGAGAKSSLNMSDGRDRALVRRAVRDGFDISPELKAALVEQLAGVAKDPHDQRELIGAARVLVDMSRVNVALESLDQTDFWNNDKNERLDAGKATERVGIEPVICEEAIRPPKQLPPK